MSTTFVHVSCCFSPVLCVFIESAIFLWESVFKASFQKNGGLFIWVCSRVLTWMFQKIISSWSYPNKKHPSWVGSRLHSRGTASRGLFFFHIIQIWKFPKNDHNNGVLLKRLDLSRLGGSYRGFSYQNQASF